VYAMATDEVRERFYLSDFRNHRILLLNLTDNSMQLAAGTGLAGANDGSLNFPAGVTIDPRTGSFYVADSRNHRIQQFAFNSMQGITVAGGTNNGSNITQLNLPSGVALDPSGNVYVADTGNHRIMQWLVSAQQGRVIAGK
jgi:sugar lactone lactonase YvrE